MIFKISNHAMPRMGGARRCRLLNLREMRWTILYWSYRVRRAICHLPYVAVCHTLPSVICRTLPSAVRFRPSFVAVLRCHARF